MARLMAVANGDNTSASTWGLIDSTSFLESETANTTLTTSYVASTAFTPGVITIDGIAVRIYTRIGTTGTLSVELYNSTAGASVAGSEVTVNTSDVVDATTAFDGGWMFFKFSTPILLLAATNYQVRAKTSSSSQISLNSASGTNWSRILRTTTTQAPAAGDDRFVMGEWTAAATTTTRTVTLNDTSTVDYGSTSTSIVNPALSISAGGIVQAGTTASTTYIQKISGTVIVYNGGTLNLGTTSNRMPTSSSFVWTFDCVANVDFGIQYRRKAIGNGGGEDKTRWTLLSGDEAAAQTVIGVVSTAGWRVGDTLSFAPTGTTTTQGETKTILTVDSSTQVTLTAGLTNAHTGTGDVVGAVGNLSSNVQIIGTSTNFGTFITFFESSNINYDNVEFRYLGSSTTGKRGVEIQQGAASINSATVNKCSIRDTTATGILTAEGFGTLFYITNNVITTTINSSTLTATSASGSTFDVSGNLISSLGSGSVSGMTCRLITGVTGICSNNTISGVSTGVNITTVGTVGTETSLSGFTIYSCNTGMASTTQQKKVITSFNIVCCTTGIAGQVGIVNFVSCNSIGNSSAGVSALLGANLNAFVTFTSCTFRGRTSFNQGSGLTISSAYNHAAFYTFNSCTFGVTNAHTTADINVAALFGGTITLNNCTLASSTEFNATIHTLLDEYASVRVQRLDTTAGNHRTYVRQGVVTSDTTISRTASPSLRITPKSATIPATTVLFSWKVPINSGQTCTPSVYVRESVVGDGTDYNGNFVKLYVKANFSLGITSDTLLDTATATSTGAFEQLTGTTATTTDAGVLEFYLVCDGTTGWVNADDFTATNA